MRSPTRWLPRMSAGCEMLKPILAKVGLDRIKASFVGGAPSAPELSQFFRAVGCPMLEAYGLTEGSLNVFNRIDEFKGGTAGTPLPGVELRLAEDGEILLRGDLNFVGYRKQPEQTAEALDADGWLHTGDIGELDDDGYLTVVDRKKEIIISAVRQEHVAGRDRVGDQGGELADRPGGDGRRRAPLQHRAPHARPRGGSGVGEAPGDRVRVDRGAG